MIRSNFKKNTAMLLIAFAVVLVAGMGVSIAAEKTTKISGTVVSVNVELNELVIKDPGTGEAVAYIAGPDIDLKGIQTEDKVRIKVNEKRIILALKVVK